jgi:phenylpyruvate tautomerase PptA (4-oxalocrotonate tautomerase family)
MWAPFVGAAAKNEGDQTAKAQRTPRENQKILRVLCGFAVDFYSWAVAVLLAMASEEMPLIQVFTSAPKPPAPREKKLLGELSRALSTHFGKSEEWVMTCLVPGLAMTFAGAEAPSCFAAVKNVGKLAPERATRLSEELTARLAEGLGVPKERVYIEFSEAEGRLWGWNGETFG